MSVILITGGTGLVGTALCKLLIEKGHQPTILGRSIPRKKLEGVVYAIWDVEKRQIDMEALLNADHIVHLAGASVFEKRWTKKRKKEMLESRTISTDLLVQSLTNHVHKVKTMVSASAIGWYGADKLPGKAFTEEDPADAEFLGQVCKAWEHHAEGVASLGIRLTELRFGLVLSNNGGFMEPIQKPLNMGLAMIPGSGKQMLSWIHIRDLCRLIVFAIENEHVKGSINAVAPQPVPLGWLVKHYAKTVRKNAWLSLTVPSFLLRWVLGERSTEVTKSCTVSCTLAKSLGFNFLFPSGESVINALATNPHE